MHLRLAFTAGAAGLTSTARPGMRLGPAAGLVVVCVLFGACRGGVAVADDVHLEWRLRPEPPIVGEPAVGELRIGDREGRLLNVSSLRVEAHMSHPGMAPIVADAARGPDGAHEVQLQFTMAGPWILRISGQLADGRRVAFTVDVPDVRERR